MLCELAEVYLLMGDAETQALKEDVSEIKSDVKDLKEAVAKLHLLMVEKYVTRKEFEAYKEKEINNRRWWTGIVLSVATVIAAIVKAWPK